MPPKDRPTSLLALRLTTPLITAFDRAARQAGYLSRSEALRDLVRRFVADCQAESQAIEARP